MEAKQVEHSFPAFYEADAEILILGSIPSVKSREIGFYYMHPQNRFWKVLTMIYQEEVPDSVEGKKDFLRSHKIALWDVLASCTITGSQDSTIQNPVVNPIAEVLERTQVTKICTTGRKAYELYQKYCLSETKMEAILLPSTSPLNCAHSLEEISEKYRTVLCLQRLEKEESK